MKCSNTTDEPRDTLSEGSNNSLWKSKIFSGSKLSWWVALGIVLFISLFFKETVFQGKPISKIYEISRINSFFNPNAKDAIKFCPIDPCIYSSVPAYIFNEKQLRGGSFPFWSATSGTGYPHFASIDNGVMNPLRFFISSSTEYNYNLSIVIKVAIASLGMFGLIRAIGLSRWSSIFASIIYPLCPFILREIEISFESWCYPLLIWLFISCMKRSNVWSSCAIGIASAFTIASLHPTSSVYILSTSSILGFLTVYFSASSGKQLEAVLKTSKFFLLSIFIGFCFAAPVLFSFVELALNSWNYKNIYSNDGVPWQGLALMLTNPTVGGASLYLGAIAALMIPMAVFFPNRKIIPFTIFGITTFLCFTTISPLNEIFNIKPITYLRPKYFLPIYLLIVTVMSAYGFDLVRSKKSLDSKAKWIVLLLAVFIVLGTPGVFKFFCIPFTGFRWDGGMPCFDISTNAWRKDILLTIIFLSVLLFDHKFIKEKFTWVLPSSCVILAAISLLTVSRLTLPTQPSFFYPPIEPIKWLQKQDKRCMGVGSLSFVYGIDSFHYHSSFYLSRYVEFLKCCGGERSYASYVIPALTPAIDIASVKYSLSSTPVLCSDDKIIYSIQKNFRS